MNPLVILTLAARTKLAQRYAREMATDRSALTMNIDDIERRLQLVFPLASVVIVQDLYEGFRRRDDEYVLQVEVTQNGVPDGPAVVKLGPPERLEKEMKGFVDCRPQGLKHDLVLMDLAPIHDSSGSLIGLIYADAEQLIGVDQTLTLEAAMLDAVRLGEPTIESVADLLFQLYERLGMVLYRHCFPDDPKNWGTPLDYLSPPNNVFASERIDRHLGSNLILWKDEPSQAFTMRAGVTTELDGSKFKNNFRDPVFMLQFLLDHPQRAEFVPQMLRGRSHGDLHGRNVLVGKIRNRVLWPAVYDFGDMGTNNLIGRDFVKLEIEFKIRAYPGLFSTLRFTEEVTQFETRLFEATEKARESAEWPILAANPAPADRLTWLLLQIRRMAMNHLSQLARTRMWLMEYYFLLAVYGLNSVRFENLTPIEQKGAYLSAGCAAARYLPLR